MEADVTMPEPLGLDLSGSSDAKVSGFESSKSLVVDFSGNSALLCDDQAELHDVIGRIRDINMPLISVNQTKPEERTINFADKGENHEE